MYVACLNFRRRPRFADWPRVARIKIRLRLSGQKYRLFFLTADVSRVTRVVCRQIGVRNRRLPVPPSVPGLSGYGRVLCSYRVRIVGPFLIWRLPQHVHRRPAVVVSRRTPLTINARDTRARYAFYRRGRVRVDDAERTPRDNGGSSSVLGRFPRGPSAGALDGGTRQRTDNNGDNKQIMMSNGGRPP